jgi:hypothetical protein
LLVFRIYEDSIVKRFSCELPFVVKFSDAW